MIGWSRLLARMAKLFRDSKMEKDLRREISSHLILMEDDIIRRGMSPAEASRAAQRPYGNMIQIKELHRKERSLLWPEQALFDLRYAVRGFRKHKLFTIVAALTLALGIGANTAIFSIIDTVLFHPLPYPDADRLVAITSYNSGSPVTIVSLTRLNHMRPQVQSLEQIGAYYVLALNLSTKGAPEQAIGAHASRELFQVLGVEPMLGRGFLPEEDQLGGRDVALISNAFWRRRFGADPEIAGKSVSLDGRITTIIGVLPPEFRFPFFQPEPQVWLPRVIENPNYSPQRIRGGVAYLLLLGKLRKGEGLRHLRAELDTIGNRYRQAFPSFPDAGMTLTVAPLEESLVANVRPSLLALLGAAGSVLLIACVNVAGLLLARAISREKEIGIRRALGAARGRLIRQLLTESLALSLLGGGLGIALAAFCLPLMMRMLSPGTIPLSDLVDLNRTVLFISFGLCVVTGIIFGLAPALQASPRDLDDKLKQGNRGSTSRGGRARQAMVVCEVALTLMLMTGASLLLKSVINLMRVNPGFVSQNVMTFFVSLPPSQYPQAAQRLVFYRRLLDQVASVPGVNCASVVSHLPLGAGGRFMFVCPEGRVCQGVGKDPLAAWRQVSPDFFQSMRIPLLHGRAFDERDRADSPLVAIVNQTIAARYFPGVNPVGRHIAASRDRIPMEIVGVVPSLKFVALTAPDAEEVYVPYTQTPWPSMTLVVRSNPSPPPVAVIRQALSRIDPDVPLAQIQSLDQIVTGSIAQPRLIAGLVSAFALAALFFAAIGIYGVMAYLVTQRSPEIAIRMALGAQRWSVFRLVVGHGMKLVLIGLALGLVISLAMTHLLTRLLFGASPTDLFTLTEVSVVFAIIAFAACSIPSRRAMRLDALATLRCV